MKALWRQMTQAKERIRWTRVPLLVKVIMLALALNILAWILASWHPEAHGSWRLVNLFGSFLLGLIVGRWRALLIVLAYGVIHAIPVRLGLLPGYLSTWGEALWWTFALFVMLGLTTLGVLGRGVILWLQSRSATKATELTNLEEADQKSE